MIRSIRPGDIPACVALYNHYVADTTITFEEVPLTVESFTARVEAVTRRYPFLVWEDDHSGKVIGYAYLYVYSERTAYRFTCDLSIYIKEGYGHCGIGNRLYRAIEKLAYAQGIYSIFSVVSAENPPSLRFHERQGFTRIADLDDIAFKKGRWIGIRYYRKFLRDTDTVPRELYPPVNDYCEETE